MNSLTLSARHYAQIERAILFLDARWDSQPSLAEVAAHVGLSEAHFDRLFTRWAGVSAMRFLRFLTKEQVKARLRSGMSVLHASLDAGLSGPGRLHDLMVTCEAVTPGEYRSGGTGVEIRYGFAPTPFGEALIAATPRGICSVQFATEAGPEPLLERLRREWPAASLVEDRRRAKQLAGEIFSDSRPSLHLRGTNFQLQVWQALLTTKPGDLVTYGDLAESIGVPFACRAVGTAVGANPISILVPCHRVIRKTGAFGNYRWGAPRKIALCGWEAARINEVVARTAPSRRLQPA